jgi:hypothetical protein
MEEAVAGRLERGKERTGPAASSSANSLACACARSCASCALAEMNACGPVSLERFRHCSKLY